jgi:hypothetical protein
MLRLTGTTLGTGSEVSGRCVDIYPRHRNVWQAFSNTSNKIVVEFATMPTLIEMFSSRAVP